jgi:hypothetical protein
VDSKNQRVAFKEWAPKIIGEEDYQLNRLLYPQTLLELAMSAGLPVCYETLRRLCIKWVFWDRDLTHPETKAKLDLILTTLCKTFDVEIYQEGLKII